VDTPLERMKLNADTRRDAVASFVAAADRSPLRMEVIASKSGKLNKVVFDGCQQQGWYAYLDRPRATPASVIVHAPAVTGEASIVQFNHPGGEHVPRQNVMPWNTGRTHRRKFLRTPGSAVNPEGEVAFRGDLVFWGEWEPPSRIAYRWGRHARLPTVVHIPYWGDPPPGIRQNTDPWVFGPEFLYGNCKQRNPSGSPAALQNLMRGSLILFGSVGQGQFVIDTVFVVADAVGAYRPIDGVEYGSEAFQICAIDSLATDPRPRGTTYTLFRGATPDDPVNGMFSFVPCRPWVGDSSRFACPAIRLDGVINPRSRQSASGAKHLRSAAEVYAAWRQVVRQVLVQDLQLGVGIADPPRHE